MKLLKIATLTLSIGLLTACSTVSKPTPASTQPTIANTIASISTVQTTGAQVQYANVNGAQIAYYIMGQGTPLIMNMSFGMTLQDWDPRLLAVLAQKNQVILYDYRGVGLSNGDIQNSTITEMANDVTGLMDALHIQQANLLGFSIGSFVVQQVAISNPNRVLKIVLAGTAMPGKNMIAASPTIMHTMSNNLGMPWPAMASMMFTNTQSGRNALYQYLGARDVAIANGVLPQDKPETLTARQTQWQAIGTLAASNTVPTALAQLKTPTLVAGGLKDQLLPPKNQQLTAKQIPGAKLIMYPNAGHAFLFQYPEQFGKAINQFLKQKSSMKH